MLEPRELRVELERTVLVACPAPSEPQDPKVLRERR